MADRKTGIACLFLVLFLFCPIPRGVAAQEESTPSLEFNPSTEVVPGLREQSRSQAQVLFTRSVGRFGIGRGSFDGPVDVVHDDNENYFVLDAGNQRVQKYNSNDRFESEWGSLGTRDGEFKDPSTIERDSEGSVYVVDTGNHRVQKFNPEGNFLTSFGRLGTADGRFNRPTDITFDDEGNIFILDSGNDRIQKFSSNHVFEEEWGRFNSGRQGDFENIVSIAFDDEKLGRLFLLGEGLEEGTCLIQILEFNAARREVENTWIVDYPESEEEPCVPTRIRIDNRNDYVYILDHANSVLRRFTKDGRYLDSVWEAEDPLNGPRGFSVDPVRRQVHIADTENDIVQIFTLR